MSADGRRFSDKVSRLLGDHHDLTVHVDDPELHALIAQRREELLLDARCHRYVDLVAA